MPCEIHLIHHHHLEGEASRELLHLFREILNSQRTLMADAASILAKITANTNVLKSVATAADALKEGQATIADEIKALKDAVAAGTPPDFTAIDTAADEQAAVIDGLNKAIPANTPAQP